MSALLITKLTGIIMLIVGPRNILGMIGIHVHVHYGPPIKKPTCRRLSLPHIRERKIEGKLLASYIINVP